MSANWRDDWKLIDRDGREVKPGQELSWRDKEVWTFLYITRAPEFGKSGKIYCRQGDWAQELYPTSFDLTIVPA
jgi:hypothetical protein